MRSVYFDHNATTPLDPAVREAMAPFWEEHFGNPSSIHHVGRAARHALDDARSRVAQVFRCKPAEILFTSGGTESNNLALFGTARLLRDRGCHLITSSVEHPSVLACLDYLEAHEGFSVTRLPVDGRGIVAVDSVREAIRNDTTLVSIMAANNETGAIQPTAEIGALCRSRGVLFHTDAVQSFGKLPFLGVDSFQADLISFCSHKCYGPKGSGILFVRSPLPLRPILFGGGHELEKRAGTENVAFAVAAATVIEHFIAKPVFEPLALLGLTSKLASALSSVEGVSIVSPSDFRLPNTLSFIAKGCDSLSLLAALDLEGICASGGSACSSGSLMPSHVLMAMGFSEGDAASLVRLSLGRSSTLEEVDLFLSVFPSLAARIRSCE